MQMRMAKPLAGESRRNCIADDDTGQNAEAASELKFVKIAAQVDGSGVGLRSLAH